MKTHQILQDALCLSRLDRCVTWSASAPGLLHPDGVFTMELRRSKAAAAGDLRFAASDLGVGRVEMNLLLPREEDFDDAVALYYCVARLWERGYSSHFSRLEGSGRLQVRAQVFIRFAIEPEEDTWDGIPAVSSTADLARWLRISLSAARTLLPSPVHGR